MFNVKYLLFLLLIPLVIAQPIKLNSIDITHESVWLVGEENGVFVFCYDLNDVKIDVSDIIIEIIGNANYTSGNVIREDVGVYRKDFVIESSIEEINFSITANDNGKIINKNTTIEIEEKGFWDKSKDSSTKNLSKIYDYIKRDWQGVLIVLIILFAFIVFVIYIELLYKLRK